MNPEFEHFIAIAGSLGQGREQGSSRQVPLLILDGVQQEALLSNAVEYLTTTMGYALLDLRLQSPESAVEQLALPWRELTTGWPRGEDYQFTPPDSQRRLLVVGGADSNDVFWRMLSEESLLYAGFALPPTEPSPRCVVVPDSASVIAAATSDHAAGYRLFEYFGAAGRFGTIE